MTHLILGPSIMIGLPLLALGLRLVLDNMKLDIGSAERNMLAAMERGL